jgi:hypothetical protein
MGRLACELELPNFVHKTWYVFRVACHESRKRSGDLTSRVEGVVGGHWSIMLCARDGQPSAAPASVGCRRESTCCRLMSLGHSQPPESVCDGCTTLAHTWLDGVRTNSVLCKISEASKMVSLGVMIWTDDDFLVLHPFHLPRDKPAQLVPARYAWGPRWGEREKPRVGGTLRDSLWVPPPPRGLDSSQPVTLRQFDFSMSFVGPHQPGPGLPKRSTCLPFAAVAAGVIV